MTIKTYIIDSFTDEPFKGNPAGVCLLDAPLLEGLMQSIAAEIHASETAFLVKDPAKENTYNIRYFTPEVEVVFCGHASFASAKLLLHLNNTGTANLITGKGLELSAWTMGELTKMHFPVHRIEPYNINPELLKSMGIENLVASGFDPYLGMLLIEVTDKETLLNLSPDFTAMLKADKTLNEVVVTAASTDKDYDFYSRCFCPWIGIDEDPVTGAAHSVLAPFWQRKTGKNQFKAYQCSKRGGYLNLEILGDNILQVLSNARIVLEGVINL